MFDRCRCCSNPAEPFFFTWTWPWLISWPEKEKPPSVQSVRAAVGFVMIPLCRHRAIYCMYSRNLPLWDSIRYMKVHVSRRFVLSCQQLDVNLPFRGLMEYSVFISVLLTCPACRQGAVLGLAPKTVTADAGLWCHSNP